VGFNDGQKIGQSYYVRTANKVSPFPALEGEHRADLCIVGGGCSGLSAALFAARKGYGVVLIEGGRIGWGASGRNGGQIIPGLRLGPRELLRRYGEDNGKRLYHLALSARDLVQGLIDHNHIACDLVLNGHLQTAAKPGDLDDFKREAELAASLGYPSLKVLTRAELATELASEAYHGGLLDERGGHFHPLNYALGLAAACQAAGVILFENSPVRLVSQLRGVKAETVQGFVTAGHGILACDALLGGLQSALADRMMPIMSHIVTTKPLPADLALIPHDRAVSDTHFNVNYFRVTHDNRLLFGGGERYWPGDATDIAALVRRPLERIFPQLRGTELDHAWGGLVSVTTTRLPDIGRFGDWFYAQGYSGQGAILSSLAGQVIAEAAAGTMERFDLLHTLAPPAFPGGRHLRTPLHVLGMFWYALRDRLGI
jgi:gamma-glutamylputrescine oxidase